MFWNGDCSGGSTLDPPLKVIRKQWCNPFVERSRSMTIAIRATVELCSETVLS